MVMVQVVMVMAMAVMAVMGNLLTKHTKGGRHLDDLLSRGPLEGGGLGKYVGFQKQICTSVSLQPCLPSYQPEGTPGYAPPLITWISPRPKLTPALVLLKR